MQIVLTEEEVKEALETYVGKKHKKAVQVEIIHYDTEQDDGEEGDEPSYTQRAFFNVGTKG